MHCHFEVKRRSRRKRMLRYYLVAAIVLIADQFTKWLVVTYMNLHESIPVIGEFFQITSHRNKGAAFGILQNQRWFFLVITVIIVIAVIWYLHKTVKEGRRLLPYSLSLLLGGALGNFIDRALTGEVVDFMHFTFRFPFFGIPVDYQYPIFNVADSAIVIAVILIFIDTWLTAREEKKESQHGNVV
jgi:signal peptidase II